MMKLTLAQAADYLETATIERTHDFGHSIVHGGTNEHGIKFVMVNNTAGETALTEGM